MKHKFLFKALSIMFMVLFCAYSTVQAGDAARIGTSAGTQLEVAVGARDLGMGGANIALTSGLESIFWNPGGLAGMQSSATGMFSTMTIFNDIAVNYLAVGINSGDMGVFAFNIKTFDFGDIPLTTNEDMDGLSGRTFSPTFVTAGLTYGKMLTDNISLGVTGKIVHESVPRASATAFAFDAGIQYHGLGGLEGVSFGIALKNIGTNMEYEGSALLTQANALGSTRQDYLNRPATSDQLPASVDIGLGYVNRVTEDSKLTVSTMFQNNNFSNDAFKFGVEYDYNDLVAVRGGYLLPNNTETEDNLYTFSLGAGLHYKLGDTDFQVDYAYRDVQYFDGESVFTLSVGF